ncbi:MAG: ABC transporter permease subunit, partial [Gammaproteobacteria bacterium]|nr:ABC transporter permease subunit [Gammaproteobacteria bacterium]
ANRVTASGMAIASWFLLVLVYDLILLGLMVATSGQPYADVFPALLLLNPADVFRILNVYAMEEMRALYGLATAMPGTLTNPWLLGAVMLAWIVVPLALAYRSFRTP